MPQLSNITEILLALLFMVLLLPVYGDFFLYLGWTKLSIVATCAAQVAFLCMIALAFRRRRK
jgi:hypothetical protein